MNLTLIDISNTRTKIASSEGVEVAKKCSLPTSTLSTASLRALLQSEQIDPAAPCIACSVVPEKSAVLAQTITGPVTLIDHRGDLGITIDYPNPGQIGPDRLANAVACAATIGVPSVAIDFGTAVTFDVVGPAGSYLGGVIAPGLEAMTHYLHDRTALLPELQLEKPATAIGKSTIHAMQTGAIIGYRGLVKEILAAIFAELPVPAGTPIPVVATGGNAHLICHEIAAITHFDENLTLHGLRLIGQRYHG
jgi:type III pantothenate kinase